MTKLFFLGTKKWNMAQCMAWLEFEKIARQVGGGHIGAILQWAKSVVALESISMRRLPGTGLFAQRQVCDCGLEGSPSGSLRGGDIDAKSSGVVEVPTNDISP